MIFKKLFVVAVAILLILGCASSAGSTYSQQTDKSFELTVLHTNDHHGHPVKFFHYPASDVGGLPARVALVDEIRLEVDNLLVLDAGDLNTGRPESLFFKAEPDIIGYNKVGYDAVALGNHEFDNALSVLQDQIALSNFSWLSANTVDKAGNALPNVDSYIIKDFDGFKVAIFGLVTATTKIIGNPSIIDELTFRDEVETASELVPKLREEADLVIALVHLGMYDDNTRGSRRLAAQVPGIDLIIDGHSHTDIEEALLVKNEKTGKMVPVVQAWQWGLVMGRVDIQVENGNVASANYTRIPVNLKKKGDDDKFAFIGNEIQEDKKLLDTLTANYVDKVDAILGEQIGRAEGTFLNDDVRKKETALGDMVADVLLWHANKFTSEPADFAIQNGGGIRQTLPAGDFQKSLIYEILPFDNSVMIMTLKGTDTIDLFNFTGGLVGKGAFPQVSEGVSFTINENSQTVSDVLINGKPIDPNRLYRVVTNSYMAAGGDGYSMFRNAVNIYDSSAFQRDAFIDYVIDKGGVITPELKGRITITDL
jgi:5'-nucleotidase/UDP-sugar diphosphatase